MVPLGPKMEGRWGKKGILVARVKTRQLGTRVVPALPQLTLAQPDSPSPTSSPSPNLQSLDCSRRCVSRSPGCLADNIGGGGGANYTCHMSATTCPLLHLLYIPEFCSRVKVSNYLIGSSFVLNRLFGGSLVHSKGLQNYQNI